MASPRHTNNSELLIAPHISEKASALAESGVHKRAQYIFRVANSATKLLLKKAVEDRYGVQVQSVQILHTRGKVRRRGTVLGRKPGFKKAIVALRAGQVISEF